MTNQPQSKCDHNLVQDLDENALEASSKFAFVISTPSYAAHEHKDTQTLVRKHVMRPFTKPKRKRKHEFAGSAHSAPSMRLCGTKQPRKTFKREDDVYSLLFQNSITWLGAAHVDPFAAYPIQLDSQGHELIKHIWQAGQVNFQPFRDFWFPLGLVDAAAMHLILSNAMNHLSILRGRTGMNCAALTYDAAAIRSVNERLSDVSQNTTDSILGAILGFMCHDHIDNRYDLFSMHTKGFKKMLALRGGLGAIESNREVRLSLFWIEHNMMSDHDIVPQFHPPTQYLSSLHGDITREQSLTHCRSMIAISTLLPLMPQEMMNIMTELSALTLFFGSCATKNRNIWQDSNFAGLHIYATLHKVLAVQKVVYEDDLTNVTQEIYRLGALLFLAEIRRKFAVSPVLTDIPVAKLQAVLKDEKIKHFVQMRDPLVLWVLIMAGCASSGDARSWIVEVLRDLAISKSDTWGWNHIMQIMSQMWWVEEVFASKCQELQVQFEFENLEVGAS